MKSYSQFTLTGVVQGVGFRPYICHACTQAGLTGYVQNIGTGVIVVVDQENIFRNILDHLPKHIRIDTIRTEPISGEYHDFSIRESSGTGFAEIPPDLFLCDQCQAELSDANNRRHGYFFLTCTECGPRYTITSSTPYDRETTTMRAFPLCEACRSEYTRPDNRRFHAQTIACHDCGPTLSLFVDQVLASLSSDEAKIAVVADALEKGIIVSVKGIGGFHLLCDATEKNIRALDTFTKRAGKPYALLCQDLVMARSIADITEKEAEILTSPARPIVLCKKKKSAPPVSELDTIGIMLSYTALHELLFQKFPRPLVCTSSNRSDAPLSYERKNETARVILDHDREICHPIDDSIVKVIHETPLFIRRSRGYVPRSIPVNLPASKPILALGAEMNHTFALFDGRDHIILSPHLGNTSDPDSFTRFTDTLESFLAFTGIQPETIVIDAHPGYRTSEYGVELADQWNIPLKKIQHHRAHAFGVALEHGLKDFSAIVCDGLGFGDDGTIWGGEVFENAQRIGHLEAHPQLGGDSATRFPDKMLYSFLRSFLPSDQAASFVQNQFSQNALSLLEKQYQEKFHAPLTSSCGRVLDAAAALLGLCHERTYDGRPAMLLEAHSTEPYSLQPVFKGNILLTAPLFAFLIEHLNDDRSRLAATVEHYLAEGLYTIAEQTKKPVVWAGGCAYNRLMTTYFLERGVLVNKEVPSGDGGISFGQIAALLADAGHDIA